jgi:hypothetical protein
MFSLLRQNAPRAAARAFSTTAARPLAKMQIIGRLADTPEEHDTSSGKSIVRYALGVSSGPKDADGNRGVSWFRVASFMQDGPQKDLLLSLPKGLVLEDTCCNSIERARWLQFLGHKEDEIDGLLCYL